LNIVAEIIFCSTGLFMSLLYLHVGKTK